MKNKIFLLIFCIVLSACTAPSPTQPPTPLPTIPATQPPVVNTPTIPPPAPSATAPLATATLLPAPTATTPPFTISSTAFENQKPIPAKYTCQGENISPHLKINGVPKGAVSLALIMEDPDAPGGTFIHWVLYNLPPTLGELNENVAKTSEVPGLGLQGLNSSSRIGYFGPCPPAGSPHRYYFKLYALDLKPDLPAGLTAAKLMDAMKGHILLQTEWMGTYARN